MPLGLCQTMNAGDIHSFIGSVRAQDLEANLCLNFPEPDGFILAAAGIPAASAAFTRNIMLTGYWPPTNEMARAAPIAPHTGHPQSVNCQAM